MASKLTSSLINNQHQLSMKYTERSCNWKSGSIITLVFRNKTLRVKRNSKAIRTKVNEIKKGENSKILITSQEALQWQCITPSEIPVNKILVWKIKKERISLLSDKTGLLTSFGTVKTDQIAWKEIDGISWIITNRRIMD